MSESSFRRLSGLTEDYADWRRDDKPTTRSLAQIQIKRMAGLLEEERWMTHLPSFDWDKVERLMEAALAADNVHPRDPAHAHHKESANAHWDARLASAKAHELDKGSDSFTSHKAHGEAAHAHRVAAHLLRSSGDHEFADTHEKWAEHHTTHARAHANTLRGKHGGKPDTGFETEPDPFPSGGGDKKPKPKAPPGDLKSPPKKGATSDSEKSAVKKLPPKKPSPFAKKLSPKPAAPKEEPTASVEPVEPAKTEPVKAEPVKASSKAHLLKKAGKSKAGLDKEWEKRRKSSKSDHPVVQAGKTAAKAALSGEADDSTSHEELSKLYSHAAKAKMAQAMHHFKNGDHEHALSAFNSALHHTKKADEHKKAGATGAVKRPAKSWVGKVA